LGRQNRSFENSDFKTSDFDSSNTLGGRRDRLSGYCDRERGGEYEALKNRIGDRLIRAAERYIPGLSRHLEHAEYATPLSNEYWVNAVKGGSYGPEQTPDQMGPGRFPSLTAGIEGLFLVGAGTFGGGIMPCVASGVLAAERASRLLEG